MLKENAPGITLAFVIGVGLGTVAGLLLAPKAGDELRDDIVGVLGDGIDQIREQGKTFRRRTEKLVDATKDQVQSAFNEGDQAFKQAKKAGA